MAQELTSEFIHKMLADSYRIIFAGGGINTVTVLHEKEKIKINEYKYNFQIKIPSSNTLLTINKEVKRFGFADTLHPDDSKYVIKERESLGYIFSTDGAEIMFDTNLWY